MWNLICLNRHSFHGIICLFIVHKIVIKACLDVEPVSRPRAYQLMAYFRGGCLLPVNMVYGGVAKSFSLSTSTNLPFCNLISESQFIQMAAPIRMGRSESMDRLPGIKYFLSKILLTLIDVNF